MHQARNRICTMWQKVPSSTVTSLRDSNITLGLNLSTNFQHASFAGPFWLQARRNVILSTRLSLWPLLSLEMSHISWSSARLTANTSRTLLRKRSKWPSSTSKVSMLTTLCLEIQKQTLMFTRTPNAILTRCYLMISSDPSRYIHGSQRKEDSLSRRIHTLQRTQASLQPNLRMPALRKCLLEWTMPKGSRSGSTHEWWLRCNSSKSRMMSC